MSLPREVLSGEQTKLRSENQWSRVYFGIYQPNVIYTALLNGAPASNDMIGEISFDGGTGTLADVKAEMWLWVGSSAGARDLGTCRIRKAPVAGTFYIGHTSEVAWVDNCHLTVVDVSKLAKKPVIVDDGDVLMDGEHAYSDQHEDFDPVPVLGCHAAGKMESGSLITEWDASDSWVFGSTISSYLWSAPGGSIDDDESATPVITYDTAGHYTVRCTVTAANGKSATGVRHVMAFDDEHPPLVGELASSPSVDYDSGGWVFSLRMYADADPTEILEDALCILFSEDWYGNEKGSLGPLEGRENIVAWGWIAGESIDWDPEGASVEFTVQGPHDWMKQITMNPTELIFATNTPDAWNVMPNLTVDRGLWHLLHWRSNASALLDIRLTGDTRYAPWLRTLEGSLWSQLDEVAFRKIFGRIGCDRYGRFFAMVDPQCVPGGERDWETVMTLTKKDWQGRVNVSRSTRRKLAMLSASGWKVDASGSVATLYSLALGHIHAQHGGTDTIDQLLVEDQTQANEQAGLYAGWKNNEFEFEIALAGNNRFVDVFPNQFLAISLSETDTPRGIAYSGNLVPRSITLTLDTEANCWLPEITCEAETFAELAIDGDIPPSSGIEDFDLSMPPLAGFPSMPNLPPMVYLPPSEPNANPPQKVVICSTLGVFYYDSFDDDGEPVWKAMNNGIDSNDIGKIRKIIVTPGGVLYIYCHAGSNDEGVIYRASGLGGTWYEYARGGNLNDGSSIVAFGYDPNYADRIAFVSTEDVGGFTFYTHFHIGTGSGYSDLEPGISVHRAFIGDIAYFNSNWYIAASYGGVFATASIWKLTSSGTYVAHNNALPLGDTYIRHMQVLPDTLIVWSQLANYAEVTSALVATSMSISLAANYQGVAFSPTGTVAIGAQNSFGLPPYKTTDGGATWSNIGGVISTGLDIWENCGDDYRWIAGGGMTIKFVWDAGDSVPIDLAGNLGFIAPLIDITGIRFIE